MTKIDIPFSAKAFFTSEHFNHNSKNILLICSDEENALESHRQLLFLNGDKESKRILFFPSLDTVPYDRISPNIQVIAQRTAILSELASSNTPKIIVTASQNLLGKLPAQETFKNSLLTLTNGFKTNIKDLSNFLVDNGYIRASSAVDSSEFAVRGEIVDLVTHDSQGYRINFAWEQVESIREFDPYTQLSDKKIDSLTLSSASDILFTPESINNFKEGFLKNFGVNHTNHPLYNSVIEGKKFHGYEHLLPLFYRKMVTLLDYIPDAQIIYDNLSVQAILEQENSYHDFYESRLLSNKANPDSFYFALKPEDLITDSESLNKILTSDEHILLEAGSNERIQPLPKILMQAKLEKKTEFEKLFELITEHKKKIPIILCNSISAKERIKNIAKDYEYITNDIAHLKDAKKNFINITVAPILSGFITEKYLFIAEQDILGSKFTTQSYTPNKKKLKNILTELDNILEGEYIVHKEHGVGMFANIHTITVDNIAHDCLKIIYANNDILYLPVENIDQIKKYGNNEATLDKLGGSSWQSRTAKLKNRIKDIASALLKTTAERALTKTNPVDFDLESYDKFCKKFPYNETEDQVSAISDVKSDLATGKLMDRLICGDVGFGKTEVAMRAAFMVSHDTHDHAPQIAIISPTTILCRQHYSNFCERFKGTNLKIAQLSRLVKPSEATRIKHALAEGDIDIVIGTHTLLASAIKFKNLKMIIIDEEQHFGVAQKEHLKRIKKGVHVLSLSATPIPRTLQMSMVGIKDLSIIATPPIDRLPVKTSIMPFDGIAVREALMRERFRGGVSFYVAPRIKDLEWIEKKLKELVPELKYKVAHGQMPPAQIDQIMSEFCDAKFDILLSTSIIESGIDIPIANTMIIHRADMFGLSQLYQLRGRVGRGKVRGYTYLTLTKTQKTTKNSLQRLDILQNINSLGAGFTIASHDMDLRGFGNLVGSEQSGHIKEVGSELYQEMLDEAIAQLQNNKEELAADFVPSINLNIPVLIPASYIEDSSLRLAIYRRSGDLKNLEEIEKFNDEMVDRFGPIPQEFRNLLEMVKIKNLCLNLKIESLDSGPNGFVVKFNQHFDVSEMVMNFVKKYPRFTKIKPDNKLIYLKELKTENLLKEASSLIAELERC